MKKGFTEKTLAPVIYNQIDRKKWSICVGAGTSQPIFPMWNELVNDLILEVTSSITKPLVEELVQSYKPDALIQAVFNRLKLSNDDYINLLSNKLYQSIRTDLTMKYWESFKSCLCAKSPADISDVTWADFDDIISNPSWRTSAYYIGKVISDTIGTRLEPNAIISFNAESLLYAIIHHFTKRKKRDNHQYLDFVNLSISSRHKRRIPYIFCHGTLPVPDTSKKQSKRLLTNEKLVFLENEYLQLANNSFSWQSNSFLEIINSSTVIFIGVSLTDPNMRRWLSWAHKSRVEEIQFISRNKHVESTKHYWIHKEPRDAILKNWIEASVAHLGVRLIWISDWDNIGEVLKKMLNMN